MGEASFCSAALSRQVAAETQTGFSDRRARREGWAVCHQEYMWVPRRAFRPHHLCEGGSQHEGQDQNLLLGIHLWPL
jgi:hypothetical protein